MIYLYKNITPNCFENSYIVAENDNDYMRYLGTPYLSFVEDSYLINENIARVNIAHPVDMRNITYLVWNNNGIFTYYHVNESAFESGNCIFYLSIDEWATALPYLYINQFQVLRSNLKVQSGVYNPIKECDTPIIKQSFGDINHVDDLAFVFTVLLSNGTSTLFTNNTSTRLALCAVTADQFAGTTASLNHSLFECAIDAISGIYGKDDAGIKDASVLNLFIVPRKSVRVSPVESNINLVFNGNFSSGTMVDVQTVLPHIYDYNFEVSIDPNFVYRAGTELDGIVLTPHVNTAAFKYRFIYKQADVQVIVQQGQIETDITDSFSVSVTSNDGNLTSLQRIEKIMGTIGGLASGGFQIAAGGSGYVTGALTIASALEGTITEGRASFVKGGDGLSTFLGLDGEVKTPFIVTKRRSRVDENSIIAKQGFSSNFIINSIFELQDFEIVSGERIFVQGTANIKNTQIKIGAYLLDVLERGAFIEFV